MIDTRALLARNLNGQGELYHFQGQYKEARQYYERAISQYEANHKALCDWSKRVDNCAACGTSVATVRSNFAKLYDHMGHYDEARTRYEEVIEIINSIPEDRVTNSTANVFVGVLNNLGELYHYRWFSEIPEKQYYIKAEQYYRKAIDKCRQYLGERSPLFRTLSAHQARLDLDRLGGRDKEAKAGTEVRYLDVVSSYEEAYEQGIPDASMQLAVWLNNLALIYQRHHKHRESQQRFEQAEKLYNVMGWTSHFAYAVFLTNYAHFMQSNDDWREEAHTRYQRAESIYRDRRGEFYKFYQIADFLYYYAHYFSDVKAKNYDKALELLEKAIEIYSHQKPCLGHDLVINALKDYREYYRKSNTRSSGRKTPEILYNHLITKYMQCGGQTNLQIARIERLYNE